jgi:hypothetical protein
MDEKAHDAEPWADPGNGDRARSTSADRLVARLAELRSQLELLAPPDQARGREAIERIRQAQERITTLELMLTKAREREDGLTTQTVRDRATITEHEARIVELSAMAAREAASDQARRRAEADAADSRRRLSLAHAEVQTRQVEIQRLRAKCSELETDLRALAADVAAAAVARAEASRVERERNEARDRAFTERRLAADDRRRAAEAELRAAELQNQLWTAERRLAELANERSAGATAPEAPAKVLEPVAAAPPWIELQRSTSTSADRVASETPRAEPSREPDLIDLTEEPETGSTARIQDVPDDSGAPGKGAGIFGRVLGGRRRASRGESSWAPPTGGG